MAFSYYLLFSLNNSVIIFFCSFSEIILTSYHFLLCPFLLFFLIDDLSFDLLSIFLIPFPLPTSFCCNEFQNLLYDSRKRHGNNSFITKSFRCWFGPTPAYFPFLYCAHHSLLVLFTRMIVTIGCRLHSNTSHYAGLVACWLLFYFLYCIDFDFWNDFWNDLYFIYKYNDIVLLICWIQVLVLPLW